VHTG
ncbi:phosphate binding family protein, partial [Vibrio parahaemolyticus EKP-008]